MKTISIACLLCAALTAFGQGKVVNAPAMILVEGGTFAMGSAPDAKWHDDEGIVHQVTLDSFYIASTETTQALYLEITGKNPSNMNAKTESMCLAALNQSLERPDPKFDPYRLPVERVSWIDAASFCNLLSKAMGYGAAYKIDGPAVSLIPGADGFRLPTEAEWEYAARGGRKSGGRAFAGSDDPDEVAWYSGSCGGWTQPIGERPVAAKAPNELGLYDMSGNVLEWCWDWYGPYDTAPQSNPAGPPGGTRHVRRGGDWGHPAWILPCAYRAMNQWFKDDGPAGNTGFRVVRPARN